MEVDFPFARSVVIMRTERTVKKTGTTTKESHYYLSSLTPEQLTDDKSLALIRGHWGGVEIRNHWRRDALMGEDGSRSRNPNLLANMALIRSALLALRTTPVFVAGKSVASAIRTSRSSRQSP